MDTGGTGEGECGNEHTQKNTSIYPGSGPSCGGNTPTPACPSYLKGDIRATMELLELYGERRKMNIPLCSPCSIFYAHCKVSKWSTLSLEALHPLI